MTLPLITEHFDLWTSTVRAKSTSGRGSNSKIELAGIKKLRELILELAVRGKLVPHDPNDEPASVLLARIEEEKARLIAEGKLKKEKPLPPVSDEEKPFELPEGWEWARLGSIGDWGAGATPLRSNPAYYGGMIPWFKSGELTDDFISESEESVTEKALAECSLRLNKIGDVLLAMYGATIGKASILKVSGTTNQAVCACTPFNGISNIYLLTLLKAYRNRFIGMGAGGAQPNISREKIIATPIGLPPTTEQHRIVAKVDELMALCDQLEQQTEHQLEAHKQLVETLLESLTRSTSHAELVEAWQRLAAHFDLLFSGPMGEWAIDRLKDTILQLAVMGKLVPQNPDDEPASVLLARIEEEKARLVAEGKLKKQKPLPPVSDEEKPFELPNGWVYIRLCDLGTFAGGKTPSKAQPKYWNGMTPWVSPKDMKSPDIIDTEDHVSELAIQDGLELFPPNTVLIVVRSGILRHTLPVAVTHVPCTINQDLKALKLLIPETASYVRLMLMGFERFILDNLTKTGTTVESMKVDEFMTQPFIIPPLAEQQRIIAKVNELLALCDQLKVKLQAANETQLNLTEAIVQQALA